jgi:hypothetical protein
VWLEGSRQLKKFTSLGLDAVTFWLVAVPRGLRKMAKKTLRIGRIQTEHLLNARLQYYC